MLYFSILSYVPYSLNEKVDSPFVRLEYVILKKENIYLTIWFHLFGHHQVFKILYQGNCCSAVVLVIVHWLIFIPSVCTCNMWCFVMFLYCIVFCVYIILYMCTCWGCFLCFVVCRILYVVVDCSVFFYCVNAAIWPTTTTSSIWHTAKQKKPHHQVCTRM
jgi:hypothetical protein